MIPFSNKAAGASAFRESMELPPNRPASLIIKNDNK
jgi:hypothetical protein